MLMELMLVIKLQIFGREYPCTKLIDLIQKNEFYPNTPVIPPNPSFPSSASAIPI